MVTRASHVVRITDPADATNFVDVEVIDNFTYVGPNGEQIAIDVRAANARPLIIDDTGNGMGREQDFPTRVSHIEVRQNPQDSSQKLAIEVLDALSFTMPNGAQRILWFPSDNSAPYIAGGNSLTNGAFTRASHLETIKDENDSSKAIVVQRTDSITYKGPNGFEMAIVNPSQGITDSLRTPTGYTPDGDVVPPPNGDPNPYIKFIGGGPWLGLSDSTYINQGPLWYIVGANAPSGPWYWWIPVQQEYQWSYDTLNFPEPDNHYSEAVWQWQRLPNVGSNYGVQNEFVTTGPGAPLSAFGYGSLEDAILAGTDGWGVLDLEVNYPKCVPGVSGTPDIWDITGIANLPQIPPPPGSPPGTAPTDQPVPPELAARVATAYGAQWQETSDGVNGDQEGIDGTIRHQYDLVYLAPDVAILLPVTFPFPQTAFHVPLGLPVGAPNFGINTGTFLGGVPAAYWFSGGVLEAFQPAYATYLNVGQLDQKKWDTSDPEMPVLRPPSP